MENEINVSKQHLLEQVIAGYDFANEMCGIATHMQDLIAQILIANDRAQTKKTGALRPHEMHILKSRLVRRYPDLTAEQISFMQDSIEFYLEGLEDKFPIRKNEPEEPKLSDLQIVVLDQMLKQEMFESILGKSNAYQTRQ